MHRFALLIYTCVFAVTPGFSRQDPIICGTHLDTWKEQLHLHRQSVKARALARSKAGLLREQPSAAGRDIGNIAILADGDGVVARRNDFNLDRKTVTFTPSAPDASRYRFQVTGDTYDPAAASSGAGVSGLGDDDSREFPLPFSFPFFGASYQQIFINSDGNLSFVKGDSSSSDRSIGNLVAGPPRIAGLFRDLDPSRVDQGVRVLAESSRFVVSWMQVPEFSDSGFGLRQTFQIRLYPDGRIEVAYAGITTDSAVVGISPGGMQGSSSILSFLSGSSSEFSSTVAERFSGKTQIDMATAAQKFYETHDDSYDYLVFINNQAITAEGAVAFESTVRNNRSGYGDQRVDVGREYGSANRLQAVINLGPLNQYPKDPNSMVQARRTTGDTPLTVIAHETGHLFLAYASVRDPQNPTARPMLGFQNAHWNFTFNSEASLLEGNRIRDDGPNASPRFVTTATVEGYAPLDQYLMGFRAAEEVPATFLVTGTAFGNRQPQTGVSFDGQRRDVRIEDIIEAEGRRIPDYTVAQRRFRFAFIMVTRDGAAPAADELAQFDAYRREFEAFYTRAASGRAYADASLRQSLVLSTFPASGVVEGQSVTAAGSIQKPAAAPLTVVLRTQTGNVTVPASVTIPAGATAATFTITGLRAGVDEISAEPSDSSFDTAYSKVQVATPSSLRLTLASKDNPSGKRGEPLADPVVVKVVDANNISYSGVRIQASVSGDGSVGPAESMSDGNGQAMFRWTLGSTESNTLSASLPDAPDSTALEIQATVVP